MNITKPIRTEQEYQSAIERIDVIIDADAGTAEADELELLAILVEAYEDEHYPIEMPSAIDAIKFRMEQMDMKPADLIPYIGSRSKVSEVLSGKRPLSLNMIRRLHKGLGISAEVLLQDPAADLEEVESSVQKASGE